MFVEIDNNKYMVRKQLKTVDNKTIGFIESDINWSYGIKDSNGWKKIELQNFHKLKMYRKAKDNFINNPSIETLETIISKLLGKNKYTVILNLAELKWSKYEDFMNLATKTKSWHKIVNEDIWNVLKRKEL